MWKVLLMRPAKVHSSRVLPSQQVSVACQRMLVAVAEPLIHLVLLLPHVLWGLMYVLLVRKVCIRNRHQSLCVLVVSHVFWPLDQQRLHANHLGWLQCRNAQAPMKSGNQQAWSFRAVHGCLC